MRNRVERLRVYLLGSAVFLMLMIAAFIGSARYLSRHRLALPARLGVNIVRETNGYTYSQSMQGKTVYTIHAARAIEHTDGKIALHDVSIVLYGRNHDRNDRIYGNEFEYDQNAGVVRALGLVHIDLQAAATPGGRASGASARPADATLGPGQASGRSSQQAAPNPKVLHVTTSGLVYTEKLGVAATGEYIEFQAGAMTGHATGGDYSTDSGLLMLHSAVSMSGIAGGRPVTLTASTADLDNRNQQTFLTHAKYVSLGRTALADQATLHTRPDGTLARVEADGNVTTDVDDATVVSQRADVVLNGAGQPQSALLTGGVRYSSDRPLRQARGRADEAAIAFDRQAKPQPEHAVFTGAVHMTERTRASEAAREPWSVRDLTAAKFEAALAPSGNGNSHLRDAEAMGSAHVTVVNNGSLAVPPRGGDGTSGGGSEGSTELWGDSLKTHLIDTGDARRPSQLDTVQGRGHTVLRQLSVEGIEQTSAGDTLDAKFRQGAPGARSAVAVGGRAATVSGVAASGAAAGTAKGSPAAHRAAQQDMESLLRAVQQGHVAITRRVPATGAAQTGSRPGAKAAGQANAQDDVEHALAERAVYDGDLNRTTLTGDVQVSDAGSVLWASQVALDRATGDAHAEGAVKVSYASESSQDGAAQTASKRPGMPQDAAPGSGPRQTGESEPVHILADRADLKRSIRVATFYGKPARLWQGSSQVQAPVLEFARAERRLIARGEISPGGSGAEPAAQVHTLLVSAQADKPGAAIAGLAQAGLERPASAKSGASARPLDAVRIASRELIYSDILRQAEFIGDVRAQSADGIIRASQATVYLQPAAAAQNQAAALDQAGGPGPVPANAPSSAAAKGAAGSPSYASIVPSTGSDAGALPSFAGKLERVVATGQVEIEQPGRRATGGRLVYTASDGLYVLTGEGNVPPKLVDATRGTVTGAALRFHSGDDSVVVSNVVPGASGAAPGQRVRTDTRVSKDAKPGKGKP